MRFLLRTIIAPGISAFVLAGTGCTQKNPITHMPARSEYKIPKDTIDMIAASFTSVSKLADSLLLAPDGPPSDTSDVMKALRARQGIDSARVSDNALWVWLTYGGPVVWMWTDEELAKESPDVPKRLGRLAKAIMSRKSHGMNLVGSTKAVLIFQMSGDERFAARGINLERISRRLSESGFDSRIIYREQFTLDYVNESGWNDAGYLYILTHGRHEKKTGTVWLMTGQEVRGDEDAVLHSFLSEIDDPDWRNQLIFYGNAKEVRSGKCEIIRYFGFSNKYLERQPAGCLSNACVISSACSFLADVNRVMGREFKRMGAGAVIGWDAINIFDGFDLTESLLTGITVSEALADEDPIHKEYCRCNAPPSPEYANPCGSSGMSMVHWPEYCDSKDMGCEIVHMVSVPSQSDLRLLPCVNIAGEWVGAETLLVIAEKSDGVVDTLRRTGDGPLTIRQSGCEVFFEQRVDAQEMITGSETVVREGSIDGNEFSLNGPAIVPLPGVSVSNNIMIISGQVQAFNTILHMSGEASPILTAGSEWMKLQIKSRFVCTRKH